MPSRWLPLGAVALGCSCAVKAPPPSTPSAAPTPTESAPAPGARPTGTPSAPSPTTGCSAANTPAAGALEKSFTGQAQPSLTVKNAFPTSQHLFIDWVEQSVLRAGATQTFPLSTGAHTITSSESTDPDDHPAAVTEAFESGYAYRYEIRAR